MAFNLLFVLTINIMNMFGRKFWVYVAVVMSMVFWSLSFIWYKDAYEFYGPITLVQLRLIVSSLFLIVVTGLMGKLTKVNSGDFKIFMLLAFFEPFMYFIGESHGMTMISSTLASVLISIAPLLCPIGDYYFFGKKVSVMSFVGIFVSVLGVCVVIFHNGFEVVDANPYGILLMMVAVLSTLGYSITVGKLASKYNVFTIITYQNTIGAIYFIPLFLIFEFDSFMQVGITAQSIVPILKLGIFASTFAFLLYTFAIKYMGITRACSFTNAIPVLTAIFAYFMLGEELSTVKIIGITIVVVGLFLSQNQKGVKP